MSETSDSSCPAAALMGSPISMLDAVSTASNGPTTFLRDSITSSCRTLAWAASATAFFAAASPLATGSARFRNLGLVRQHKTHA